MSTVFTFSFSGGWVAFKAFDTKQISHVFLRKTRITWHDANLHSNITGTLQLSLGHTLIEWQPINNVVLKHRRQMIIGSQPIGLFILNITLGKETLSADWLELLRLC